LFAHNVVGKEPKILLLEIKDKIGSEDYFVKMKILITGGCGFIGSHLAVQLVRQFKTVEIVILDDLSSGKVSNLEAIESQVNLVRSDIRSYSNLLSLMSHSDYVFHLAALTSVSESIKDPLKCHDINNTGTLNVLLAAVESKVSRVIISSSCSIYGDFNNPPLLETYLPAPKSLYAASKMTAETLAESFYHSYGLETVCLRYFNVYGRRQRSDSDYAAVIPRFVECYRQKKNPQIYGDGQQSRDFIHVSDVVRANILAATLSSSIIKQHRVFNIGTGHQTNLLDLLDLISQQTGYYLEPNFLPSRQGEVCHSFADVNLSREKLGFQPLVNLEEGIKSLL